MRRENCVARLIIALKCTYEKYIDIVYFCRSFIFPLLIKTQKPTPLLSFLSAVAFCALNGYIQSRTLTHFAVYKETWITDPRLILGIGTFLVGMGINIHSDHILRNLRKGEDKGYKIPKGMHILHALYGCCVCNEGVLLFLFIISVKDNALSVILYVSLFVVYCGNVHRAP